MHSPYTPDLDAPNMANPFEAETFRAGGGLGKVSLKTGLGSLRGGIRESITSSLKIVFKSPRNIKRIMKGSSDEAIEFAIKNSDEAAESLATQITKWIQFKRGEKLFISKQKFIKDLHETHRTWKPNAGKSTTNVKGVEYSNDIIAPFYQGGGEPRVIKYKVADPYPGKQTAKELEGIGSDGNVLAEVSTTPGATNDMESALRQLETSVDGNPIKSSMDKLLVEGGSLSDEGIEIATKEIATGKGTYGDDFIKSLNDVPPPTRLRNQPVDDIAKRALGTKSKFGFGIAAIVGGTWIANNILTDFASQLWGDSCTREYFENAFPDASAEELDAKVEACLDQAAKNIMYLGAAAVGLGGLLALFVLSRIIRKKSR
jgi:hypothetical protein